MTNCAVHLMEKWRAPTAASARHWERALKGAITKQVPKGEPIFEEGERLDGLYFIYKGACKFFKLGEDDREHIYRLLGAGEMMGKRSVLTNQGAKVAATALVDTQLCFVPKEALQELLAQDLAFSNRFTDLLIEDMNQDEQVKLLLCSHKSIKKRLAQLLLFVADKFGTDTQGRLVLPLKREDMAALLGTSQEYVINLLANFKNFGQIHLSKRTIYIPNRAKLHELSE
jgi:CRP-like cAMP-binding protein